jgi:hypothetical protein
MSYAGTHLCHDADSHIMEPPDVFREFADAADRDAMPELNTAAGGRIGPMIAEYAKAKKHSPEEVAAQVALSPEPAPKLSHVGAGQDNRWGERCAYRRSP